MHAIVMLLTKSHMGDRPQRLRGLQMVDLTASLRLFLLQTLENLPALSHHVGI